MKSLLLTDQNPKTMAAIEAVAALSFSLYPSSSKTLLCPIPIRLSSLTSHVSKSVPVLSHSFSISPLISTQKKLGFILCSTVQEEVAVEAETEETQKVNVKRKLFVLNLPWSFKMDDIKDLFAQCGEVKDVEVLSFSIKLILNFFLKNKL